MGEEYDEHLMIMDFSTVLMLVFFYFPWVKGWPCEQCSKPLLVDDCRGFEPTSKYIGDYDHPRGESL